MYDPQLMRFTSRDPVKGKFQQPMTLHAYLYCMNDPTNKVDPSGGFASRVASGLIAGAAVHSAAIYITGEGVYGDPKWMDIGLAIEHLVAPAVALGAAVGPELRPALLSGGRVAIKAGAAAWDVLAGGTMVAGRATFAMAKGISLWAIANPLTVTRNAADAISVFGHAPFPPHTPAGVVAFLIQEIAESNDY